MRQPLEIRNAAIGQYSPGLLAPISERPRRHSVFISYSHQDKKWQDLLQDHLKPVLAGSDVSVWSDLRISAGSDWQEELELAISRATVAVLLVSPGFLASDFVMSQEVPIVIEKARRGGLEVVWIPISACAFDRTVLRDYQAAWSPQRPLDTLKPSERNRALASIADLIGQRVGWKTLALKRRSPVNLDHAIRQ